MRFYNGQHRYYCGVDLHTKRMYLCILDHEGNTRLHRNVRAKPHDFLSAIEDFRDDLVVGAECMFVLCAQGSSARGQECQLESRSGRFSSK